MTPARASLLLLTATLPLTVAACHTVRKPIRGFDEPPAGSIVLDADPGGTLMFWTMFDLPQTQQVFHPRLNGQDVVYVTSNDGFYDYVELTLQGWTGGWSGWFSPVTPGTYSLEIVDSAGQSWGKSAPIAVPADDSTDIIGNPMYVKFQAPSVVFAHFGDTVASWNIQPALQDINTQTDEITVTNLVDEDAIVERCLISSGQSSSCTPVGTVAAGGELLTVETMAVLPSKDADRQALVIHLASDASKTYQRDLVAGSGSYDFGAGCQVERIFVHGPRPSGFYSPTAGTSLAMSSCYGYNSGPALQ
jgi:hypothetical protein